MNSDTNCQTPLCSQPPHAATRPQNEALYCLTWSPGPVLSAAQNLILCQLQKKTWGTWGSALMGPPRDPVPGLDNMTITQFLSPSPYSDPNSHDCICTLYAVYQMS